MGSHEPLGDAEDHGTPCKYFACGYAHLSISQPTSLPPEHPERCRTYVHEMDRPPFLPRLLAVCHDPLIDELVT